MSIETTPITSSREKPETLQEKKAKLESLRKKLEDLEENYKKIVDRLEQLEASSPIKPLLQSQRDGYLKEEGGERIGSIPDLEQQIAKLEREIRISPSELIDEEVQEHTSLPTQKIKYTTFTENGMPVPIYPDPKPSTYEIIVGKQSSGSLGIEYPVMFSELAFGRAANTLRAGELIPGTEITFNPDYLTIYQYEVKIAHDHFYEEICRLKNEYSNLNPDSPDYDSNSKAIWNTLQKFTDKKSIRVMLKAFLEEKDEYLSEEHFNRGVQVLYSLYTKFFEINELKMSNRRLVDKSILSNYVETPYTKEFLDAFVISIKDQIYGQRYTGDEIKEIASQGIDPSTLPAEKLGATIIEGSPGIGKNYLINYFAAKTNRPMFRYVCTPTADVPNELEEIRLVDGETIKIPGEILLALQTPNSILVLDEVNLLNPGVAKFFNSLLDGDRAISTRNALIKAAPGVVIVGLMNPKATATNKLAETIMSRTRVIEMKNPPVSDLALIVKRNLPESIRSLSSEQFLSRLNLENRSDIKEDSQTTLKPEDVTILNDIKILLKIAKKSIDIASKDKNFISTALFTRKIDQLVSDYLSMMLWDDAKFEKLLDDENNKGIKNLLESTGKLNNESKRVFFLIYKTFTDSDVRSQYSQLITSGN